MRVATVALAVLLLGHPAAADADSPGSGPSGARCALGSVTDPGYIHDPWLADYQVGAIVAGPLFGEGTLICTIQVNAPLHSGPNVTTRHFADTAGVVAGVEYPVVYPKGEDAVVYLCASFVPNAGSTLYWRAEPAPDQGSWTTSASTPCASPTQFESDSAVDNVGQICPLCVALITDRSDWRVVVAVS